MPYRGSPGTRRALNPVAPADANGLDVVAPGPTVAVIPSPKRVRRPPVELEPFAPTGVQVGELRLLPFVEGSVGYETNPNQVTTGVKRSPVLRADAGLDVASDTSTNSLTASLRGGYSDFPANSNANRPDFNGVVDGVVDVTRNDQINLEGRLAVATQTPGSPLLAVANSVFITDRPTIITEGATLGGAHTFNRLTVSLKGTFDRTEFGDATQSDGSIFRFSQDNYNDYGVIGRAAYEVWPAFIPFLEAGADTRVRDNAVDLSGYYRDSVGVLARAGANVEFTRLLTGTISAGYAERHYADPRLQDLSGPTIDGSLVYQATPLTAVKLTAATTLAETTLAGASGAISRSISLELDHQLFRNFILSGIATYQPNQYQGIVVNEAYTTFQLKGRLQPQSRGAAGRLRHARKPHQHARRRVQGLHLPHRREAAAVGVACRHMSRMRRGETRPRSVSAMPRRLPTRRPRRSTWASSLRRAPSALALMFSIALRRPPITVIVPFRAR